MGAVRSNCIVLATSLQNSLPLDTGLHMAKDCLVPMTFLRHPNAGSHCTVKTAGLFPQLPPNSTRQTYVPNTPIPCLLAWKRSEQLGKEQATLKSSLSYPSEAKRPGRTLLCLSTENSPQIQKLVCGNSAYRVSAKLTKTVKAYPSLQWVTNRLPNAGKITLWRLVVKTKVKVLGSTN